MACADPTNELVPCGNPCLSFQIGPKSMQSTHLRYLGTPSLGQQSKAVPGTWGVGGGRKAQCAPRGQEESIPLATPRCYSRSHQHVKMALRKQPSAQPGNVDGQGAVHADRRTAIEAVPPWRNDVASSDPYGHEQHYSRTQSREDGHGCNRCRQSKKRGGVAGSCDNG